tara:strand:+ start:131 stop:436 length:306 start_codon:yes stop_codon:yes gene_type:complete
MDNINVEHNVSLTEGQIATILYILEGAIQGNDEYNEEDQFQKDVDSIFERLEGVVDKYYETKVEKAGEKNNAVTPTINGISVNLANGALKDYYAKLTSGKT